MSDENATEETENAEAPEETVEPTKETTEETTEEVVPTKKGKRGRAVAEPEEVIDNSKHDKPLYTGDLGGHALLGSTSPAE